MYVSSKHLGCEKAFGAVDTGLAGVRGEDCISATGPRNRMKKGILLLSVTVVLAALIGGISYFAVNLNREYLAIQKSISSPSLLIESTPIGARVLIDGTAKGLTPLKLALPAGKYEVKVTCTGYYDWEAQVALQGENEVPILVNLLPIKEKYF